eukprot:9472915-Pyramimonas_sp.AAC.1
MKRPSAAPKSALRRPAARDEAAGGEEQDQHAEEHEEPSQTIRKPAAASTLDPIRTPSPKRRRVLPAAEPEIEVPRPGQILSSSDDG